MFLKKVGFLLDDVVIFTDFVFSEKQLKVQGQGLFSRRSIFIFQEHINVPAHFNMFHKNTFF